MTIQMKAQKVVLTSGDCGQNLEVYNVHIQMKATEQYFIMARLSCRRDDFNFCVCGIWRNSNWSVAIQLIFTILTLELSKTTSSTLLFTSLETLLCSDRRSSQQLISIATVGMKWLMDALFDMPLIPANWKDFKTSCLLTSMGDI